MRVIDGARARVLAIAMAVVATIQIWPSAVADETPRQEQGKSVETKAPKKTKKKRPGSATRTHTALGPWQPMRTAELLDTSASEPKKPNPIKVVLKSARAQLGDPYRYGAVGPSSFDCSGFTMYVWRKAGVTLPHNSSAQNGATKDVPLSKLRPGDLVFSSGHVGLYVGKGKMIHAPHSGRNVEIAPIHSNAYAGGRPKP